MISPRSRFSRRRWSAPSASAGRRSASWKCRGPHPQRARACRLLRSPGWARASRPQSSDPRPGGAMMVRRDDWRAKVGTLAVVIGALWLVAGLNVLLFEGRLLAFGILPRAEEGLRGV